MEGGHIRLQMVTCIVAISSKTNAMDVDSSRGLMEICTRENAKIASPMGQELSGLRMEIYTREILFMVNKMGWESIVGMTMEKATRADTDVENSMAKGSICMPMAMCTRENTKMDYIMEEGDCHWRQEIFVMGHGMLVVSLENK